MAIEITIPRLGWSMEEGTFSAWLKGHGEKVNSGDMLFAVESDKVIMDVESLDSGFLHIPEDSPEPGAIVTPGQLIGYLLAEGEAPPVTQTKVVSETPVVAPKTAALETIAPAYAMTNDVPVTPRARRVAKELGVDVLALSGSGKGGRVRECDVREAAARRGTSAGLQVTSLRRTIASRMMQSHQNTAPVTLTCRADATRLVALREQWKLKGGDVPSYTDIVMKLAAKAIGEHPALGGRWDGDRIVTPDAIHIGFAVDTPHGLMVPVVRNVPALTLPQIARRSRELVEAAHNRRASAADLEGGVFTITNLGAFGIEAFTPIINYPETAVLGLGAIRWEAVALGNGHLATRQQISLSLTFDHRVVDGAPAARFLQTITALIESAEL